MSSYELLPCPFCGGEGKLYDDYSSERDEHRWQVWHVCDNGPEGESAGYGKAYHTSIDTPWFKSREKAVEAWNTRAELEAATLGGGRLTAEQVRDAHDKHWHDLPAEYDMPEASALSEYSYDWQAIADELNAALGGGECEDVGTAAIFKCSMCGWKSNVFTFGEGMPCFCPQCGKAVER